MRPGLRQARAYFGLYPFRWQDDWEKEFTQLVPPGPPRLQVAPVLERLVFPRARDSLVAWLRQLAGLSGIRRLIPAHYHAPLDCSAAQLAELADQLEARNWAPDQASWATLARLDRTLVRLGLVPEMPLS
jgi:hypothetical protein